MALMDLPTFSSAHQATKLAILPGAEDFAAVACPDCYWTPDRSNFDCLS